MKYSIDLNCDMGEGMPYDAALMPLVTSANIACGYHAGDQATMHATVALALAHGVAIGAHPSFLDRENFGRTPTHLAPAAVYALVQAQLRLLATSADAHRARLHHVKPHGALYNAAARDADLARAIAEAVRDFDPALLLYGLSGSELIRAGQRVGLRTCCEAFADRTYQADGSLTPRHLPNALRTDPHDVAQHVVQLITQRRITALDGTTFSAAADTVCLHSDGEHALPFAKMLHTVLSLHHITLAAP